MRTIRKGENVKLTCRAIGNPVTTYYVWRWENGTVIQNKSSGVLEFKNIQPDQGGRLSCVGGSYIGQGDKAYVNVDVRGKVIPYILLLFNVKFSKLMTLILLKLFLKDSAQLKKI